RTEASMARLSALPAQPDRWAALLERDDIVLHRGMLHLAHDDVTPDQARTADLLLTADALDDADVAHLLIRHSSDIPALVVDLADRDRALAALAARGEGEPLYVKPVSGSAVPAMEFGHTASGPSAIRVFRPRVAR